MTIDELIRYYSKEVRAMSMVDLGQMDYYHNMRLKVYKETLKVLQSLKEASE